MSHAPRHAAPGRLPFSRSTGPFLFGILACAAALPLLTGSGCGSSSSGGGDGGGNPTGGGGTGGRATGGSATGGAAQGTGGGTNATGGATQSTGGNATGGATGGVATGGGGTGGKGGSVTGGAPGGNGTGGQKTGGSGGAATGGMTSSTGGAAGGSSGSCPADATFCSGFETADFPTGAKYVTYQGSNMPASWTNSFAVDTAVFRNGKSSLRVRGKKEANPPSDPYRMLSVPAPGPAFWVHFYLRSDTELGTAERVHNEFGAAAGSADPNEPTSLEFAEDRSVAFNSHDDVRRPDGYTFDKPYLLPPNTWYCIELGFDSATRHQLMYVDGTKRIDATDYPAADAIKSPFAVYNFGLRDYHGFDGTMWIDDMIVSKTRVPCPTP